jgi:large subunit ribosomal protein L13
MHTYVAKPAEAHAARQWWIVDAQGQSLGRLASQVAGLLRGKHKPTYAPDVDTGDYVIVINAGRVKVTGTKGDNKMYYSHSGYSGSLRTTSFNDLVRRRPEQPVEKAVKGMLPKNVLGRQMLTKLKVYGAAAHPHEAQQPKTMTLGAVKATGEKS